MIMHICAKSSLLSSHYSNVFVIHYSEFGALTLKIDAKTSTKEGKAISPL